MVNKLIEVRKYANRVEPVVEKIISVFLAYKLVHLLVCRIIIQNSMRLSQSQLE